MLVSIEESGKYFLLGEKCTSNGQLCYFHTFFYCGYDYLSWLSLLKFLSLSRMFVNRFCWTVSSLTQKFRGSCATSSLERKRTSIFTISLFLTFHHSTSIWTWMVCKKLTKAKLKNIVRLMLTFRRTCPEQGLHQG